VENREDSDGLMKESFPEGKYADVPGLCKAATVQGIEEQGWSLNPGRYVGVSQNTVDQLDFFERMTELSEEFERLNADARVLERRISGNIASLLEDAR